MATAGQELWWVKPLQAVTTLSAAVNFGASGFQTPITMPVLRIPSVPAVHAGQLVIELLHRSELIFPPLNAIGTLGNLIMASIIYLKRNELSPAMTAKLPHLLRALACSIGVTVYTLTVMVPINGRLKETAKDMSKGVEVKTAEQGFRETQAKWQRFNMGRGSLMILGAIFSMQALLA